MAKLTDLQLVLLSTAASRTDGSLLPPAASVAAHTTRITQAITTLIKRAFAEEVPVTDAGVAYHSDGDGFFGAVITDAGRQAIGMPIVPAEDGASEAAPELATNQGDQAPAAAPPPAPSISQPKIGTKQALLIDLLQRDAGASLDELAVATGWLPHTTRAALTGLRKKGHVLAKAKVADVTRYTLAAVA
jgi:hypothetical protein